jgi:mono/diheme cytochrome c family protein
MVGLSPGTVDEDVTGNVPRGLSPVWTPRRVFPVALAFALASALAACAAIDSDGPVDAEATYRARCSLCHPPWDPTDFTPDEWPRYVRKYGPRAGLTRAERAAVLEYLVREAAKR